MKSTKQSQLWTFALLVVLIVAMPGTGSAYSVMAIGDSITAGYVSSGVYNGGYIPSLATRLGPEYTFVGTQGVTPYLNQGYPKASTLDFLGQGSLSPAPTQIGTLAAQHPDIMLIHLGTNDLNNILNGWWESETPEGVAKRIFESILPEISNQYSGSAKPDVYLAKIIPIGTDAGRAAVESFNRALDLNLTQYSYMYSYLNLHLVDMYTGFSDSLLLSDGLHPNADGYQFMANQWGDAILGPQAHVPIPAPAFLLASGLAGLVAVRRRCKHSPGGTASAG